MAISKKTACGWALETGGQGMGITVPVKWSPKKSIMKKTIGKHRPNTEQASRDKNQSTTNLLRKGMFDPKGEWYNDADPYLILGMLGAVSTTQPNSGTAPTVYKHAFSLADIPLTMSCFKTYDDGQNGYRMVMCAVQKLSLKWSADKVLEVDPAIEGVQMQVAGSSQTPSFSSLRAFAGWEPILKLGGSPTQDIQDVEIDFTQQLEFDYPSYGSPDPVKVYFGEREAKVKFTARADVNTLWAHFDAGDQLSFEADFIGDLIASTYHQELDVAFTVLDFDKVEHELGKTNVQVKAEATAITGGGSGWVTAYVQNTVASYAA